MLRSSLSLAIALGLAVPGTSQDLAKVRRLAEEGRAAYDRKDYPTFLALTRQAAQEMPHSTRWTYNLACAHALNGQAVEAVAALRSLADRRVWVDTAAEADFAPLRERPDFKEVTARFAALLGPVLASTLAFRLPEKDLITEGVAYDARTGRFFVSSVHHRKVVQVGADLAVRDFVTEGQDGLWAALALAVDARRGVLWVSSAALPQMRGFVKEDEGRTALFAFALDTGRLAQRLELPGAGPHGASDIAVDARGDLLVAASRSGGLYVLPRDGSRLEELVPPGRLASPQGIAPSTDGRQIYVADYVLGIARVDRRSREVQVLAPPADMALAGIDGLFLHGGQLVGIQNGVRPHRVLRLTLDPKRAAVARADVLESAHPHYDEPTLGVQVGSDIYYVANSQWGSFDDGRIWPLERLKQPVILKLPLGR
jgi:sugar lactone lactonase YvrE